MVSQESTLFMLSVCFFLFHTDSKKWGPGTEWRKMSAWWRHNLTEMLWMKQTTAEEPGRVQCPGLEPGMCGCVVWHLSSAGDNCSHGRLCGINCRPRCCLSIIISKGSFSYRKQIPKKHQAKQIKWWPQSLQLFASVSRVGRSVATAARPRYSTPAPPCSRVLTIAQWPH